MLNDGETGQAGWAWRSDRSRRSGGSRRPRTAARWPCWPCWSGRTTLALLPGLALVMFTPGLLGVDFRPSLEADQPEHGRAGSAQGPHGVTARRHVRGWGDSIPVLLVQSEVLSCLAGQGSKRLPMLSFAPTLWLHESLRRRLTLPLCTHYTGFLYRNP